MRSLHSQKTRTGQQELLFALGIAAAYYLLAKVSLLFVVQPEGFAVIWPPSGFILGVLLMNSRRSWLLIMTLVFSAITLANLTAGYSLLVSLGFAFANSLEPVLAAYLLKRSIGAPITFGRVRHVLRFVLVAVLASNALTALVGAAVSALGFGTPYGHAWIIWFIEDGVGMLMLTPLVVVLSLQGRAALKIAGPLKIAELALLLGAIMAVPVLNFTSAAPENYLVRPGLVVPLLIVIVLRFRGVWAALAVLFLALVSIMLTTSGVGPFTAAGQATAAGLVSLQLSLGIASFITLLLSVTLAERDRLTGYYKLSEQKYRLLAENARDLIYRYELTPVRGFTFVSPSPLP